MPKVTSKSPWLPKEEMDQAKAEGKALARVGQVKLLEYDPEVMLRVADAIMHGGTLTSVCRPGNADGFPSAATILRWVLLSPEAARTLAAAREISAYRFEDEATDTMREVFLEPGAPQRVTAAAQLANHLRWVSARRNPRVYSERAAFKITVPIQINTGLDLGSGGQPKAAGSDDQSVYTIEAKVEEVAPDEVVSSAEAMLGAPGEKPLHKAPRPAGASVKKRFKRP